MHPTHWLVSEGAAVQNTPKINLTEEKEAEVQRFRRKGAFIQARDNRMPAAELPGSKTVQKKQPKASVRGLVGPNRLARLDAPLHGRRRAGPPKSRPLKGRPPSWEFGSQWVAHRFEQSGHFSDEERCPALMHNSIIIHMCLYQWADVFRFSVNFASFFSHNYLNVLCFKVSL